MKLDATFRHRSFWLGFAALNVIVYHSFLNVNSLLYNIIHTYGYAGVDIFVFASGIGCYYSLEKDPDVLNFGKRRLQKLGPVYLCFAVPWMIWKASHVSFPAEAVLGNLLGIQSFVSWNYHFNWYISALILFYTLVPYMKRITDSNRSCLGDFLLVLFFYAISLPFWNAYYWNMVILARLPILCLGVIYGKLGKQGFLLTKKVLLLHFLAAVAGCILLLSVRDASLDVLWYHGFQWYLLLFIVPGACLCLSAIGALLLRSKFTKPLYQLLQKAGIYSFEIYLTHIFLFEQLKPVLIEQFPQIPVNTLWLVLSCAIIPLSFLLNRTASLLTFLVKKLIHSRYATTG